MSAIVARTKHVGVMNFTATTTTAAETTRLPLFTQL